MSVTSGFFNSLNGDRKYNAEQMSAIFDGIINDGVFISVGDAFAVNAKSGNTITIGVGRAWFNSTWIYNDALLPLTAESSETLLDRYDAVVIEINRSEAVRTGTIKIVKGAPSSNPLLPTMVSTEEVHQYPLAFIYRKAETTEIKQSDITNMVGTSACPYVTGILQVQNIDNIVAQWQDMFATWFDEMKDQLSEDAAGNLQLQMNSKRDKNTLVSIANYLPEVTEETDIRALVHLVDSGSYAYTITNNDLIICPDVECADAIVVWEKQVNPNTGNVYGTLTIKSMYRADSSGKKLPPIVHTCSIYNNTSYTEWATLTAKVESLSDLGITASASRLNRTAAYFRNAEKTITDIETAGTVYVTSLDDSKTMPIIAEEFTTSSGHKLSKKANASDYLPLAGGTVTGPLEIKNGNNGSVRFVSDNEGGNIQINSPSNYGSYWEIDAHNGDLRLYRNKGGIIEAHSVFPITSGIILNSGNIVNNFTTTAEGYVLDARLGPTIAKALKAPRRVRYTATTKTAVGNCTNNSQSFTISGAPKGHYVVLGCGSTEGGSWTIHDASLNSATQPTKCTCLVDAWSDGGGFYMYVDVLYFGTLG